MAAVAAGGAWQFKCSGTITLGDEAAVTKDVSLDASGQTVELAAAPGRRVFAVSGGTLTLTALTVSGGQQTKLTPPCEGCNGENGVHGTDGAAPGASASSGLSGTPGRNGVPGESSQGGCIFISRSAAAVLRDAVVSACQAVGGIGQSAGSGGGGGSGGAGANAGDGAPNGGDGGSAGSGGNGGNGGNGGDGLGGGIYNAGTLTVVGSSFYSNVARAGRGGHGGGGGSAGLAGPGGSASGGSSRGGSGGTCLTTASGHGGRGGNGGSGKGGAIYNAGRLRVTGSTFNDNDASAPSAPIGTFGPSGSNQGPLGQSGLGGGGGGACSGGDGGHGANYFEGNPDGFGGNGGSGGPGGSGGDNGDGGDGRGGAIFNDGAMDPPTNLTNAGNTVEGGNAWDRCDPAEGSKYCPAGRGAAGGRAGSGGAGDSDRITNNGIDQAGSSGAPGSPGRHGRGGTNGSGLDPDLHSQAAEPPTAGFAFVFDATKLYKVDFDSAASKAGSGAGLVGYAWNFGDGKTGSGAKPSHTYEKPGRFQAKLTVTDDVGQEASVTKVVEVKPKLEVTLKATPSKIEVEQTDKGAKPVKVKLKVTVKNPNPISIQNVTLPGKVDIALPDELEATAKALKQKSPPTKKTGKKTVPDLELGTLKKNESESRTYLLELKGDGAYEVTALVTASAPGFSRVTGLGKTKVEGATPLLYFAAKLGARVRSQKNPRLFQAGTPYLIRVRLENRSYTKKLLVYPIYADLDGNASDGHMQLPGLSVNQFTPTGRLDEVRPSRYLELAPRAKREYDVVVRTAASDAFEDAEDRVKPRGGTRSIVSFAKPKIATVSTAKKVTRAPSSKVLMGEDSENFEFSVDDSAPATEPFNGWVATFYVSKGIIHGLWNVTFGAVRGLLWDLPIGIGTYLLGVPSRTLAYINYQAELWGEVEGDPVLRKQYIDAVFAKTKEAFQHAPYLLGDIPLDKLYYQVDAAVGAKYTQMAKEWEAGNWKVAAEAMGTEGTERFIDVATLMGPAVLARFPAAASKWQKVKAASYARATQGVSAVIRKVTPALEASALMRRVVRPGMLYTVEHLQKLYGLSPTEAQWLADFTAKNRISVVLRSRLEESLEWVRRGGFLKPFWIKLKNVNWTDVQYLGYNPKDVGRLILREPPGWNEVAAKLNLQGVKRNSPTYREVRTRWETRRKEFKGQERKDMFKWHADRKVEGKWPWQENGVDPHVQADEISTHGFRLERTGRPGEYAIEIKQPGSGDPGVWGSVTGDIDLIAITAADGRGLTDLQHVLILKQLRAGPLGAMHPESATWVKDGKFWFKAKEDYLTNDGNCCLAQFGADGKARAVDFNKKLSKIEDRGKRNYRLWWNGGHQPPPSYVGRAR